VNEELARLVTVVEEQIPFNRVLGLKSFAIEDGVARVRIPMRDDLVGNFMRRSLHGGVISATLDLVGGIAALFGAAGNRIPENEEDGFALFENLGTIDLRVDYLRPGVGEWFEATASVLRTGKRVAVTRMELSDDQGRLIAVGTGTYIVG
jgi:uncharacterized protein (TIGR00369 family)